MLIKHVASHGSESSDGTPAGKAWSTVRWSPKGCVVPAGTTLSTSIFCLLAGQLVTAVATENSAETSAHHTHSCRSEVNVHQAARPVIQRLATAPPRRSVDSGWLVGLEGKGGYM